MRAINVVELTGPAGLRLVEQKPPSADDRVLIQVHEAGVSFPDLLLSEGRYQRRPDLPFIPGVEAAGIVLSAPATSGFREGDRVAAFVGLGGWADIVSADPLRTFPLPATFSMRDGAALPMNYLTAHLALIKRAQVRNGEIVVIHGAAGGLGTALIQIAHAVDARTIGVVSSEEKGRIALSAGADHVVFEDGWREAITQLPGCDSADVVADTVGGDRMIDSLRVLRPNGRLVVLGFVGGIPDIPANRLLLRNLDVLGVAWGPSVDRQPTLAASQWTEVMGYAEAGGIQPVLGPSFALDEFAEALSVLSDRQATGKVTLHLRSE